MLFLFLLLGGSNDGIVDVEPYVEPLHDVSVYLAKWIRSISFSCDDNFLSHHDAFYCFLISFSCWYRVIFLHLVVSAIIVTCLSIELVRVCPFVSERHFQIVLTVRCSPVKWWTPRVGLVALVVGTTVTQFRTVLWIDPFWLLSSFWLWVRPIPTA